MAKQVVYDSPSVTVWYHPESNIIHSHVHKFVSGKEFQDFLMAGYNALVTVPPPTPILSVKFAESTTSVFPSQWPRGSPI